MNEPITVLMIVNPISGRFRSDRLVADLRARLAAAGRPVTVRRTTAGGDATSFAAEAAADTALLVVVGGDGTIHEVVDGLAGRRVPILIVPTGTENLLAKYLGVRRDLERLTASALAGRAVAFDVGLANGRRFLSVAGAGYDAEVVRRLVASRRGHISYATYFKPLWRSFWEYRFPRLNVMVDGRRVFDGPGMAFVGNTSRYAIGLKLMPAARPDDGLLDLCVYECATRRRLLAHSARTLAGRHVGAGGTLHLTGRDVVIESPDRCPVEVDGELFGTTPLRCTIRPGDAAFVVPPGDRAAGHAI